MRSAFPAAIRETKPGDTPLDSQTTDHRMNRHSGSNVSRFPSPAAPAAASERVSFEGFVLDRQSGQLTRDGQPVPLAPQPFKLLDYFVSHSGRLISRDELQERVWGSGTFVDFERGLNFCILQIRTALGDDARTPRFIETVPRRGYRFVAAVVPDRAGEKTNSAPPASIGRSPWTAATITISVLVTIVATGVLLSRASQPGAKDATRVTLAILPFENPGADADAYFADGLTEELTHQVGRANPGRLAVLGRTSMLAYRKAEKPVSAIARELGADYVMEGSVRREGERLRISARLLDGRDARQIWSESFDRESGDSLRVQNEIAREVAAALQLQLPGLAPARAVHPDAHEEYLRGRYLWNQRGTPEVRESIVRYRKALAHDPRFALAWVGIAESHHLLQMRDRVTPLAARDEIRAAVEQALAADPALPSAHSAAGSLAFWYEWDWEEAERHFRRSLQLSASDVGAHHDYGWLLIARGRPSEGLAEIVRAQQLDPISPRANIDIAWAYIFTGQFDRAIAASRRILERNPDFEEAWRCIEHACLMKEDFAGALEAARHRAAALGRTADLAALEGLPPREAVLELRRMNLRRLEAQAATGWVDPYSMAAEHALFGDTEGALALLERAIEVRSTNVPLMGVDPTLRSLRGEPRFRALLIKGGVALR